MTTYLNALSIEKITKSSGNKGLDKKHNSALVGNNSLELYKSFLQTITDPLEKVNQILLYGFTNNPLDPILAQQYSLLFLETVQHITQSLTKGQLKYNKEQCSKLHKYFLDFLSNYYLSLPSATIIKLLLTFVNFLQFFVTVPDVNIKETTEHSYSVIIYITESDHGLNKGTVLLELVIQLISVPSAEKDSLIYLLYKRVFETITKDTSIDLSTLLKYLIIAKSVSSIFRSENDAVSTNLVNKAMSVLRPPQDIGSYFTIAAKKYNLSKDNSGSVQQLVATLLSSLTVDQLQHELKVLSPSQ